MTRRTITRILIEHGEGENVTFTALEHPKISKNRRSLAKESSNLNLIGNISSK
ncbi:hypothetical protein K8R47_01600 [archaeon]|nr:hypothetical protein [archaeon]